MDKVERMNMLYDFYSGLLTDKQRHYFALYYEDNLSLSEIAENEGITRQGVRDILVRSEKILEEMEESTGMYRKYVTQAADITEMERLVEGINALNQKRFRSEDLLNFCNQLYDRLQVMKL
ncbi:MAG: YlxM family DNA-binding protein [Oscillospiraceae bacterium]|nr:YlxM family DNA-binding protein [Oscillospiraceae bacterium]